MSSSSDLSVIRYEKLRKTLKSLYSRHPDASVFSPEYITVLANAGAAKIIFGTTFDEDIETTINRLNKKG